MKIDLITQEEYLSIINKYKLNIPIWSDIEACNIYEDKIFLKVYNDSNVIAIYLVPLDNNGVRRKYRYFPYVGPIFIKKETNLKIKEVYRLIYDYLFNKYDYTFIPLDPTTKVLSGITSVGGFIEMRHTHICKNKLTLEMLSSKIRNHINNASSKVSIKISNNYTNYDFNLAIKGSEEEICKRSNLAKQLIDNNKGYTIEAIDNENNEIIAGLVIIHDKNSAILLHSYQKKSIRGVIPYLIYNAINYSFDNLKVNYFDFEGSVIDDIDDFFASFNVEIMTYPYLIQASDENKLFELIKRSKNISGRIRR